MKMNELLRKYREVRGFTQKELATKLGMTHSGYSKYERGERKIDIMKWIEITNILNVPYQIWDGKAYQYDYEGLEKEVLENDVDYYERIHNLVKVFEPKKNQMSKKEKIIAKELFEDLFFTIEQEKRAEMKIQIDMLKIKYKESKLEEAIKQHKVEFLYSNILSEDYNEEN
jgi:transcriptional regulator with XRE-family HTH domain